ncbi:MAG: hypothetical protein GEV07_22930 [Streptosporangiales bacterium]|nr:hypothetical protein [Streptosporangiales bacterium]
MDHADAATEFDRQVRVLLDHGYPALAGMTEDAFRDLVDPLRAEAVQRSADLAAPTRARVPFVLVVRQSLVPAHDAMAVTALGSRTGFADFDPADIARFTAIDGLDAPDRPAYLAFDVDRGKETLNVSPDDAMPTITGQGRTPITVAEGIAFLTHHPDSLEKNSCYMLAGSRSGDRRVPALWISNRAPKLGWCWAGNRHTWLGIASCAARST